VPSRAHRKLDNYSNMRELFGDFAATPSSLVSTTVQMMEVRMPFSQIPGASEAISKASDHGYEAIIVVGIVVAFFGCLTWLIKTWFIQAENRENRMARRIDDLEEYQKTRLMEQLEAARALAVGCQRSFDENTAALRELTKVLADRPCLLSVEQQQKLQDSIR
jgi:hypothetical protein